MTLSVTMTRLLEEREQVIKGLGEVQEKLRTVSSTNAELEGKYKDQHTKALIMHQNHRVNVSEALAFQEVKDVFKAWIIAKAQKSLLESERRELEEALRNITAMAYSYNSELKAGV